MNYIEEANYWLEDYRTPYGTINAAMSKTTPDKYGIDKRKYTVRQDGIIDVDTDVILNNVGFKKIPFKFGKVLGNFSCTNNDLVDLVGSPNYVGGNFSCSANNISSLLGAPEQVVGNFICKDQDNKQFTEKEIRMVCDVGGEVVV